MKVTTKPKDHPPPTVKIYVRCQLLSKSLAPFLPAINGMIINESGMPNGKNTRKINPKVIVFNA